jgi:hypothetical protein
MFPGYFEHPDHATPLIPSSIYQHTKDPCAVFDGKLWHIYGSGDTCKGEKLEILHSVASSADGPWTVVEPAILRDVSGPDICAPGVIYDFQEGVFHMFVQTSCFQLDGIIEHLVSSDGTNFHKISTALESIPDTDEAGIYDPHPALINGKAYFVYSGFPKLGHGEIYLAESESSNWYGPWKRCGRILSYGDVPFHNSHDYPEHEWGLEGGQIVQLPNGKIVLNVVCFLTDEQPGRKQRVLFAVADNVYGPYTILKLMLKPSQMGWASGENGHASIVVENDMLRLFYQARSHEGKSNWQYGLMNINLDQLGV